jgi:hypothetical protein
MSQKPKYLSDLLFGALQEAATPDAWLPSPFDDAFDELDAALGVAEQDPDYEEPTSREMVLAMISLVELPQVIRPWDHISVTGPDGESFVAVLQRGQA